MSPENAASILDHIDRVVWLVTSQAGQRRAGLIATFVQTASLVPHLPRIVIGVAKHHHTWSVIEESNCFALHLLSEQNLDLAWRFGLQSGWDVDKYVEIAVETGTSGSPLISGTLAVMECVVEDRMDSGDRTIYLAEVVSARGQLNESPLTVKRLLQLATAEQRARLEHQQRQDIEIDAAAIANWRNDRRSGG